MEEEVVVVRAGWLRWMVWTRAAEALIIEVAMVVRRTETMVAEVAEKKTEVVVRKMKKVVIFVVMMVLKMEE